jgi:hypothetical protein
MSEDVNISVVGLHPKITGGRRIPPIIDSYNFKQALTQNKSERPLILLVSGITFHLNGNHLEQV